MIGAWLAHRRCWGGSPTNGATKVVASYTCEWCGIVEEVVVFARGLRRQAGPLGWVDVWRPDLGRSLVGVFCSPECQELEVSTWRQALAARIEAGDQEGEWLALLEAEFNRIKAARPF